MLIIADPQRRSWESDGSGPCQPQLPAVDSCNTVLDLLRDLAARINAACAGMYLAPPIRHTYLIGWGYTIAALVSRVDFVIVDSTSVSGSLLLLGGTQSFLHAVQKAR